MPILGSIQQESSSYSHDRRLASPLQVSEHYSFYFTGNTESVIVFMGRIIFIPVSQKRNFKVIFNESNDHLSLLFNQILLLCLLIL